jgi:hypothetical protein
MGFDGLMLNSTTIRPLHERHQISSGPLWRAIPGARILLLGNVLPIWANPLRLAEEIAMLDILSNGRIISGFVRGTG